MLIYPTNNCNIKGESSKTSFFYLNCIFSLYPSNHFFDFTPIFFLLGAHLLSPFFLTPHFVSYTPFFFGYVSDTFFFHEGHFSSYNYESCSATTMLYSHDLNQNNKPKAKACICSIVLDYEMKSRYDFTLDTFVQ